MGLLPRFGTFTNGTYVILGCIIFKRVIGKIINSDYPHLNEIGDWVNWPEYSNKKDKKPHFIKKEDYKNWYSDDDIDWYKL